MVWRWILNTPTGFIWNLFYYAYFTNIITWHNFECTQMCYYRIIKLVFMWAEEASSWKRHLKYFNLKQQHVSSISSRQSCANSCGHYKWVTLRFNIKVCFPSKCIIFLLRFLKERYKCHIFRIYVHHSKYVTHSHEYSSSFRFPCRKGEILPFS